MRHFLIVSLITLVFPAPIVAQRSREDPVAEQLLAPDLIMKHQRDIALTEGQERTIKEALQTAQAKFLDAQWRMQGESAALVQLLQARPVDETAVLAQVDRVLNLEREIKRAQLSLLIRIKNTLSDQQIAKLRELRR